MPVVAPAPVITGMNLVTAPASGGVSLTLTGTGFQTGAAVTVGGSPCTLGSVFDCTSGSCTGFSCLTPSGPEGAAAVVLTNPDAQTASRDGLSLKIAPTILSLAPSNGKLAGGMSVTINGGGFQSADTLVKFGGASGTACTGVTFVSSSVLTCTAPAMTAGTYEVYVLNLDGQSVNRANSFIYNPIPTITGVAPDWAMTAGGTSVTVTGAGFLSGAAVTIGGQACAGVTVNSGTSITCTTPVGTAGQAVLAVTNLDTQSASSSFTFIGSLSLAASASTCLVGSTVGVTASGGRSPYSFS
ncbi:MAG: IPT/TIG domain-containing protein, partial [Bdellovibrionota bacterium]